MTTKNFNSVVSAFEAGNLVLGYDIEMLPGTRDAFILFAENVKELRRKLRKFSDCTTTHPVKVTGVYESPEFLNGARGIVFEGVALMPVVSQAS